MIDLPGVIEDLTEVVEHIAYSHNFRSEDAQRRSGELLAGIRARLAQTAEDLAADVAPDPADPAVAADPAATATAPPATTAASTAGPATS
jgi:hypothetical protein